LKEEELDRTVWRTGFGRGCGPVVRQATEWMNVCICCAVYRYRVAQQSLHTYCPRHNIMLSAEIF